MWGRECRYQGMCCYLNLFCKCRIDWTAIFPLDPWQLLLNYLNYICYFDSIMPCDIFLSYIYQLLCESFYNDCVFLGLCSISEKEWLFSYMYSNTSDDNIYRLVYASGTEFTSSTYCGTIIIIIISIICGVIMRPHPHGSYSGVGVLPYFDLAPYFISLGFKLI